MLNLAISTRPNAFFLFFAESQHFQCSILHIHPDPPAFFQASAARAHEKRVLGEKREIHEIYDVRPERKAKTLTGRIYAGQGRRFTASKVANLKVCKSHSDRPDQINDLTGALSARNVPQETSRYHNGAGSVNYSAAAIGIDPINGTWGASRREQR